MALDFSNKDPKDPNGIQSLDITNAQDAWVKDGDWSHVYYSQGEASRAGANNKIRVAKAITNDGRMYDVAIDANGQPMSEMGDSTGIDSKQHDTFQQTAPKPIPPGGATTQQRKAPDGLTHIYGYNTATGQYDQDQGAVATRTPEQTREDAANASKAEAGAQNEQALNDERSWNEQHGYGRVTHTERQTQIRADEVQARADQNQARITAAQEASNQLARDRLQFERDQATQPTTTTTQKEGPDGKQYTIQTSTPKGGGAATITTFGPDGKPVPGGIPQKADSIAPPDLAGWRPDQAKPGWGLFDRRDQLDAAVTKGLITSQKRDEILKGDLELANSESSRVSTAASNATRVYQEEVTQRNADVQANSGRLSNANSGYATAAQAAASLNQHVAPGTGAGSKFMLGQLGLQGLNNLASGGMATVPRVAVPMALGGPATGAPNPLAPPPPSGVASVAGVGAPGAPAQPNAIGLGSVGTAPAPGGLPRPLLGPPPPVMAAPPAAPPGPAPALGQGQDLSTPPAINPAAGQAGNIPTAPVGMAPSGTTWDPSAEVARMQAEGYPDEVIHSALLGLGHPGLPTMLGAM